MTWDRLRSVRFREGGIMGKKDVPIIRPKRTWGKEQWDHYNRMPWLARRLADLMVLAPGFSSWLLRPAWRLEEKPPKRIDRKGPRDMINERTSRMGSMGKAAKIGLCVLIGIVGAEILSSAILIGLGVPASMVFDPLAMSLKLTDPITLVFGVVFFGLGWICFFRTKAVAKPKILVQLGRTDSFSSKPSKSIRDKQGPRRA
jgi:hypothetical protein